MNKKLHFLTALTVAVVNVNGFSQSDPAPFDLSTGNYSFTQWDSLAPAGTYPANMIFHYINNPTDSTFDSTAVGNGDWDCAYNRRSRNRMIGMMSGGVAFRATSSPQYDDCTGTNTAAATTRYVGAAVVGLNALNRMNIMVTWTGRTDSIGDGSPLPRIFTLRLQYRIGTTGSFADVPGNIEYVSATTGDMQTIGPVTLPSSCDNQPVVQLRWLYFQQAANDGGTRPQMSLDDISVTSSVFIGLSENSFNEYHLSVFPIPATTSFHVLTDNTELKKIKIYDNIGNKLMDFYSIRQDIFIDRNNLSNGFYFVEMLDKSGIVISKSKFVLN